MTSNLYSTWPGSARSIKPGHVTVRGNKLGFG